MFKSIDFSRDVAHLRLIRQHYPYPVSFQLDFTEAESYDVGGAFLLYVMERGQNIPRFPNNLELCYAFDRLTVWPKYESIQIACTATHNTRLCMFNVATEVLVRSDLEQFDQAWNALGMALALMRTPMLYQTPDYARFFRKPKGG